jgi:hypothetical protein
MASAEAVPKHTASAKSPVQSAAPRRTEQPDVLPSAMDAVKAAGILSGAITGTFTITHTALSGSTLHLRHLDLHGSKSRTVQVGTSVHAIGCNDDGIAVLAGTITAAPDQDIDLQDPAPTLFTDLAYMGGLAITPDEGAAGWCDTSGYGTAALRWSVPEQIRSLAATDAGPAVHAAGRATTQHGRPIRYTVASGDTSAAVAQRFRITIADLQYLNPFRRRGNDTVLYAGEGLNLDPTDRQWFWR